MAKDVSKNVGKTGIDDDLNAEGNAGKQDAVESLNTREVIQEAGHDNDDTADDEDTAEEEPEYVVQKGNSIRHNGVVYRENTTIPVSGLDAQRLLNAGVIANIHVLRQRALSAEPRVNITTE